MKRRALALAALAALGACAAPRAELAGRVVSRGAGVAGARVTLAAPGDGVRGVLTDEQGYFRFSGVAPGPYLASARLDGPPALVSAGGEKSVTLVPGRPAWTGFQLVPGEVPEDAPYAAPTEGYGALSGVARFEGRPVEGAVAYLYLDAAEGLRGPGFRQSPPTGPDGAYAFDDLAPAGYWLAVRQRRGGGPAGPVAEGDLYGVATANPVQVRAGRETRLDVHLERKEKERSPYESELARTGTAVLGRVVDESGRPAAGVYVFAYRDRDIGHRMPDFLAGPTGPDGAFVLPLGEGGLFYVGAREHLGGSPRVGERFGQYEGSADHGLRVPRGRRAEGVTLVVRTVLGP